MRRLHHTLVFTVVATLALLSTGAWAQSFKICIDPGHGGKDPGAVGCGLVEADITLSVGLMLNDLMLADPDLAPIMTRKTDVFVGLQARADYANDNDAHRFSSIHGNAFDGKTSGIETYCYTYGSLTSFDQRDRIQDEMTDIWPFLPDRGGKTAGFAVLKYTAMPATLSELAFIDYCEVDALLLSDPAEQWAAAGAHHKAIRESLGLDGMTGQVGILRGVVYEDLGVGVADMSVRIPGAVVQAVDDFGDEVSTVADDPTASWAFSLSTGTHTVTASAPGYHEGTRACSVVSGIETWCSVGLSPFEAVLEDSGPEVFSSEIPAASDSGDVLLPEIQVTSDPGMAESTPARDLYETPGIDVSVIGIDIDVDSSEAEVHPGGDCSTGRGLPSHWTAVALLLVLGTVVFLGKRHGRAGLFALLLAAGVTGCDRGTDGGSNEVMVPEVLPAVLVHDPVPLTGAAGYTQPVWSPDGAAIAFAGEGFRSLLWVPIDGGSPEIVARGRNAGYDPRWSGSGDAIAHRAPGQRRSDVPVLSVSMDGSPAKPPDNPTPGQWLGIRADRVWLRTAVSDREISPPGDRFCCATTAGDGASIAFTGLSSGVWVHDIRSGKTHHLGPGNHPRFSNNGRRLVWDDCSDDGHRLTGCTLHLADLGQDVPRVRSFHGTPPLSRHPSLGPDGASLAFESQGAIWMAHFD